jgi:hypothetical protein
MKYDFSKVKIYLDKNGRIIFDITNGIPRGYTDQNYLSELRKAIGEGIVEPIQIEDAVIF